MTTRDTPTSAQKSPAQRGLDVGYLDRMALSPFLRTDGAFCPVRAYMSTGKVPEADKAYLRSVAEKASAWTDPEVKAASLALAALTTETTPAETAPAETPTPTTPATQPPAASASNDVQSAGRSPRALDPRNIEIVTARLAARRGSDKGKPRVGDLIRYATGETRRVSYVWDDGVQPGDGSYHLTRSGHCSMSGGLDPNVPFAALTDTGLFEHAAVWIFDLDWSGAGRGVDFRIPFRVWAVDPSVESYDAHLRSLGIRAWKGEP